MVKRLPCLFELIKHTQHGDRNQNLFKAVNHLRHYNKLATMEEILEEALEINKAFMSPLPENEVAVVCQHVMNKEYSSSCWKFKNYCKHCRYGRFRKRFKDSKPGYWRHINSNNRLCGIKEIADDEYYPWDILDTSTLTREDRIKIQEFREEMGVPIDIDEIVKSHGISIGDKAKREWEIFREQK